MIENTDIRMLDEYWVDDKSVIDDEIRGWEFIYQQSTGQFGMGYLYDSAADLRFIRRLVLHTGYSGHGVVGLNDPSAQHIKSVGPIPRGVWHFDRTERHPRLGPVAIRLKPDLATDTFGRSGFYIHGDNAAGNQSASTGCIILPKWVRQFVHDAAQAARSRRLHVIA